MSLNSEETLADDNSRIEDNQPISLETENNSPKNTSTESSNKDITSDSCSNVDERAIPNADISTENQSSNIEYDKYITYDEKGTAIYTDPLDNRKYVFDKEANQWVPFDADAEQTTTNPYENEHYRWCHDTKQWILKENFAADASTVIENEFYKWDAEKNQWIPKTSDQDGIVSEYIDGVHTYTDKDGAAFFWDAEKRAWFPKIDDDFMAVYQMNYGFIDNTSSAVKDDKNDENASKLSASTDDEKLDEIEIKPVVKRKAEPPSMCSMILNFISF